MRNISSFLNAIFPVREESQAKVVTRWLDQAIYLFVWLTALAAPISIAVTNIGWIAGAFCWLVRAFFKPRPQLFRTSIDFAILAFFGWSLLSSFFSYAPDLSLDRLRVLTLFPIAYLVCQNIRETKTVKFLVGTLIFSTLVTVGWTFAERTIGRGVQVFGVKSEGVLAQAGIQNGDTPLKVNGKKLEQPAELVDVLARNEIAKLHFYRPDYYADAQIKRKIESTATLEAKEQLGFEHWQRSYNWRSTGFYGHYTTYAEVLQLIASLVCGLFTAQLNMRSKNSAFLFVSLMLMLAALLLTATRASQAAFLLAAFVIVGLGANRKVLLGALALFLPLIVVAAIYLQQSRGTSFVDAADNSTTWRLVVWNEAVNLLLESPRHLTFGIGIDSVKRFKCEWQLFQNCTLPAGHFHSTPLQIAVEFGLPALFFWLLFVWRYGKELFCEIKKYSNNDFEKGILLGAFGGLIGFLASGVVHYNLGDSEVAMVFFLIVGFSLAVVQNIKRRDNQNRLQ